MPNFTPSQIGTRTKDGIDCALGDGHRVSRQQLGEQGEPYAKEMERQLLEQPRIVFDVAKPPHELEADKMAAILIETGFIQEGSLFHYPAVKL